jgi:hypothetical protein
MDDFDYPEDSFDEYGDQDAIRCSSGDYHTYEERQLARDNEGGEHDDNDEDDDCVDDDYLDDAYLIGVYENEQEDWFGFDQQDDW